MERLNFMDWLVGVVVTLGALYGGIVGLFNHDPLAATFGAGSWLYRVVAAIVGLAALYIIGGAIVRYGDSASSAHIEHHA